MAEVHEMLGRTIKSVQRKEDAEILFEMEDGARLLMYHSQDCCESVGIEDIEGDLQSLVGSPLLVAEEVTSDATPAKKDQYDESYTWTFYKFATIKGHVDIRWYGTSSGYYSEGVDLVDLSKEQAWGR